MLLFSLYANPSLNAFEARFVVPLDMGGMYWSDRGPVWAVYISLLVRPIIPCVGMLIQFGMYYTSSLSVHYHRPVRRTML